MIITDRFKKYYLLFGNIFKLTWFIQSVRCNEFCQGIYFVFKLIVFHQISELKDQLLNVEYYLKYI